MCNYLPNLYLFLQICFVLTKNSFTLKYLFDLLMGVQLFSAPLIQTSEYSHKSDCILRTINRSSITIAVHWIDMRGLAFKKNCNALIHKTSPFKNMYLMPELLAV